MGDVAVFGNRHPAILPNRLLYAVLIGKTKSHFLSVVKTVMEDVN